MASGGAQEPHYSLDETSEPGFIQVKMMIENIKIKKHNLITGFFKAKEVTAKNATMESVFLASSFEMKIQGDSMKEMKGAKYRLKFESLPYPIVPEDSYIKGEDGWIYAFLKKQDVDESWESDIRRGLITEPENA